jgi:GT2 family glycosyltransferase
MLLSVYIPFKDPDIAVLKKIIFSVQNQTYPVEEILLINDGSNFFEEKSFANFDKLKIINHKKNCGVAEARNTAIRNCNTDLICAFDADIIPEKNCVENLVKALLSNTALKGVGGRVQEFYKDTPADRFRAEFTKQDRGELEIVDADLFGGCTLYYLDTLKKIGGYFSPLRNSFEDFDVSQRVKKSTGKTLYCPTALAWHYKKDSIQSALDTLYRWSYPHWEDDSWIFKYDWLNNPEAKEIPENFYQNLVSVDFERVAYKIKEQLRINFDRFNIPNIKDEMLFLNSVFIIRSILNDSKNFFTLNKTYAEIEKNNITDLVEQTVISVLLLDKFSSYSISVFPLIKDLFVVSNIEKRLTVDLEQLILKVQEFRAQETVIDLLETIISRLAELPLLGSEYFK